MTQDTKAADHGYRHLAATPRDPFHTAFCALRIQLPCGVTAQ